MCKKTWGWLAGEDETKNHPRSLEEEGTGARARHGRAHSLILLIGLIY